MNDYLKIGLLAVLGIGAFAGVAYVTQPAAKSHPTVVTGKSANDNLAPQGGCDDPTVLRVAKDLQEHPEKWTQDEYNLYRGFGWFDGPPVSIWTANSDYGLDFTTGRGRNDFTHYPFTNQCKSYLFSVTSRYEQLRADAVARTIRQNIEKATRGD